MNAERRQLLQGIGASVSSLVLSGCFRGANRGTEEDREGAGDVTAVEDLMREHGILRRALVVYTHASRVLGKNPPALNAELINRTASLFRSFGEEYHERKLEEAYIFPAVKGAGGTASSLPDILVRQHQRGREITEYILTGTRDSGWAAVNAERLSRALDSFVYMYRNHAAREDTIVFPAWKQRLTRRESDEMSEKFESIERQQFGGDGFEKAAGTMAEIEAGLGLSDLAQFTAPPPPGLSS